MPSSLALAWSTCAAGGLPPGTDYIRVLAANALELSPATSEVIVVAT